MKLAMIFPGQGSQYVGMGKDLYENFEYVRELFDQSNDILGFDLKKLCFEGPEEDLKLTSHTQPAILTVSTACWMVLKERGIVPAAVAGHSLGEYSALVAAGAVSFADALRLVHKRGTFMQESAPPGSMAAILGLAPELVRQACAEASGTVEVANYNCPGQIVIAGETSALEKAMELCRGLGAKRTLPLAVSGPFHSSLMAGAGEKLAAELGNINFSQLSCPLIANVTADTVGSAQEVKELLVRQISSSVRWEESVQRLASLGITVYIEVGPGKVLCGLGKKIIKDAKYLNIEDKAGLENILANLKEVI